MQNAKAFVSMPTRQENAFTNPHDKTTGFVSQREIQASNNQRLTQSQFQLDESEYDT